MEQLRIEVKESNKAELLGTVLVSDGETFWLHRPGENRVLTGRRSDMPEGVGGAGGPTTQVLQDMLTRGLDALNVEVLGQESVAGVNTWKLKLTPKTDTQDQLQLDGIVDATMWVDEARALPLKLQVDASDMGNALIEVRSLETNVGIADDLFAFTPPPGAEVVQVADLIARNRPESLTLDEARSRVSFPLLAPETLPGAATLTDVQLVGDKTVIQNYTGSGLGFSLVQSNEDVGQERPVPAGSQTQQITVRGQSATLITGSEQGSLLRWQEGGVRFVIAGTLSASDAQQVAESLK